MDKNDDLKPNSNKYKNEKANEVIRGVTLRKKNFLQRSGALSRENINRSRSHLLYDIIIPACRRSADSLFNEFINGVTDVVRDTFGIAIGYQPTNKRSPYRRDDNGYRYVEYNRMYDDRRSRGRDDFYTVNSVKDEYDDYNDLTFPEAGQAELVLERMRRIIKYNRIATVSDLYSMVDVPVPHTLANYGWTNLNSAKIYETRHGWVLNLPIPLPID